MSRSARLRASLIWAGLGLLLLVPFAAAATSPLLAYRQPVYIVAGLAGVLGLMGLALQPLLVRGVLPGLAGPRGRRLHRWAGRALVLSVAVHVAGLWLTSPPDVVDVLLLRSPTPFSLWGVVAMWAVVATAVLTLWRQRMGLRRWRRLHGALALLITGATVGHALLIEGTMAPVSKAALCALAGLAMLWAVVARNSARRRG